jgi:hypothetical protein
VPAPTLAPTIAPTVPPTMAPTPVPTVPRAVLPTLADQFRVMLDEHFDHPRFAWLDEPGGAAWLADGTYHFQTREPGEFVAVGVPGAADLGDVVVSGSFRKTGGPAGGGYGLIVRDHPGPDGRDGASQDGRFYVFEVGDKGELGVWLRDAGRWVDLLPWTASDVVKAGDAANELTVSAIGDTLSFQVNGIPVASQHDTLLNRGGAAIFVGGDGNQVALDHLTVRIPR